MSNVPEINDEKVNRPVTGDEENVFSLVRKISEAILDAGQSTASFPIPELSDDFAKNPTVRAQLAYNLKCSGKLTKIIRSNLPSKWASALTNVGDMLPSYSHD